MNEHDNREHREEDRFIVPLSDTQTFDDVIDALLRLRFALGLQPFRRLKHFRRLPEDADIAPLGGNITRNSDRSGGRTTLVEGDGWSLQVSRHNGGHGYAEVCAASDELALDVLDVITKQDDPLPSEPDHVSMGFWHLGCGGATRRPRTISAPSWADIRRNYAARTAQTLDVLMALDEPAQGRLLLLHGPPGTGKSTILRCLAREWRSWCNVEFALDPERLFKETGYLLEVLLRADEQESLNDDEEDDVRPWRLLLIEDCDELIRSEAKEESGQGLARLLNLTDGLVGEGLRILVCITTNESFGRLHPAVARPGRCMLNLEVPPLPRHEASAWLSREVATDTALAELFHARDGGQLAQAGPRRDPGQYL